jgi:RND family efflux transporter MFP subunit
VAASSLAVQLRDNDQLEIRSPFAGVVISKDAQPGEMVSPISAGGGFTRTGIATIVDMESREIEVDVNESFINRVHDNQKVEATLDAYPDWDIPAHVISIVPTADRQKATVRVRIAFNELDSRILPNMGVKTRFLDDAEAASTAAATSKAPKVRIASDALVRDGDRTYVWIVRDDAVEKRAVNVGAERDGTVEVRAGINAGDVIVSPAITGLRDGVKVEIKDKGIAS